MVYRESSLRLIGMVKSLVLWPWWRAHKIVIDDNKVVLYSGVFTKSQRSVSLDRIQDVSVRQSMLGRFFGYGTIRIETAGSGGTEIVFHNLGKVNRLKSQIQKARH